MAQVWSATLSASLVKLIAGYRRWVSPLLPPACRFHPTCSVYASAAIVTHGPVRGGVLAARRVLRCHPWCEGGIDPVPPSRGARAADGLASLAADVDGGAR